MNRQDLELNYFRNLFRWVEQVKADFEACPTGSLRVTADLTSTYFFMAATEGDERFTVVKLANGFELRARTCPTCGGCR